MPVYLKDIAAYTGVSIKTVSNVVNGNLEHVGEETRALVLDAINKLNYQPNVAARHLRKAQVSVLAYAFPDLSNPYFSDIGSAIATIAADLQYTVLLDYTFAQRERELAVLNGMSPHLIDGVILDSHALDIKSIQKVKPQGPIVLLGERLFGAPFDHVLIDNTQAACAATNHLISLGRRRIAAIGVQQASSEAPSLRLQGYMKALQEAQIAIDDALLIDGGLWHRADGYKAMSDILTRPQEQLPDAVFCFNDLMALGAMAAIHQAGCRIPQDIAVIGIDDIEDGRYATPALSTIAPDKWEIARQAVTALIGRIKGQRTQYPESIIVPFQLQARTSTIGEQKKE